MSRTYRRKVTSGKTDLYWELRDWDNCISHQVEPARIDPKSKEGRKRIAKWHSDGGTISHKEPGPTWFRRMFTERPQRQEAKRQMQRIVHGEEFEVMLPTKAPLVYWT